jgi:hypothetical protein
MPRAVLLFAAGLVLLASGPAIGQSCSQLRSCAEVMQSLRRGNRGIDGDSDGIPCKRTLCEGYRSFGAHTPGQPLPQLLCGLSRRLQQLLGPALQPHVQPQPLPLG